MNKRTLACLLVACAFTTPAFAQPDFAAAFKRLDRNGDGLISFGEMRWEGVDAGKYLEPAGVFRTDDGFGIELWRTPFGVRENSMPANNLEVRADQRRRTLPVDRRPEVIPYLMLARNTDLSVMTPERFESELRKASEIWMGLDQNHDGGISADELRSDAAANKKFSATFQTGPGGDAMRAKKLELKIEAYKSFDQNSDGKTTQDEILQCWLTNLVGAYALP